MPTMFDVNMDDGLFTMLKGEPGTRKSTQALSYPTPQYWVSTDQKMEALTLPMKRWGINPRDISFDDYSDWDKAEVKLKSFQLNCPFKTIIVDSITSIGDNITRQVRKQKTSGSDKGKMIGSISVNGLEEFNAESGALGELIAILKDINKFHKVNIVLIAHVIGARKDNDANKFTHHSRIIVTGAEKISAKIPAYCTEVYHFNVESAFDVDSGEGKYGLFTAHTGNDFARTSLPLDRRIIFNSDPLYGKWIAPAIKRLKDEAPIQGIPNKPTSPIIQPFTKT